MDEILGFLATIFVVAVVVIVMTAFISWAIPDTQWCNVVTTTGEIETQDCPTGFNSGDRIYWDNEKHTYAKVG